MEQKLKLKYLNNYLSIGMIDWKTVYLLSTEVKKLTPEVYRGILVYRAKGSSIRYFYTQIKKGLRKTNTVIVENVPSWLHE